MSRGALRNIHFAVGEEADDMLLQFRDSDKDFSAAHRMTTFLVYFMRHLRREVRCLVEVAVRPPL